jgi:hypothetical protein
MKQFGVVVSILLVLLGNGLGAFASSPSGLAMEAEAAFDGYFKYGEWLPVWVQLENSGPGLEAEVRVRVTGGGGAVTFAAPAALPTGSRKRIPVYVLPNNFSHQLEVQLVAGSDVLLSQKVPVNPQANVTYLVGLVAPERGAISLLQSASLPGNRSKEVIDLSLSDLPERLEGLRSFDCLILNDVDTSALKPEQKAALEAWVSQGGRLVIGGGAGALRATAGLPGSLLPLVPGGEVEMDALPGLADFTGGDAVRVPGPFVVATGEMSEGRTLVAQDGVPLVRARTVGSGWVYFVALDLAASPFDAWTGTIPFWEKLMSPGAAYPEWLPPDMSARQMKSAQMSYALSNLPSLDLPSIRGLGVLLLLYVLLVGPVNYLVLRWKKRLHWAWGTIPLITVAFSAGAFGLGYALRGTDLILNKIAVVSLQSDGTASVTSYLGLFSPARQSYEIEVPGNGLLSPLASDYNPWGPGGTNALGEMIFVQGEPSHVRGLAVNQWSMQTFMTESTWAGFGQVVSDLQFEDDALVGTVRNETAHTLADVVLALGNYFVRLGDLPPGREALVTMSLADVTSQAFGPPLSFRLFEDQFGQSGPGGPPREAELKRSVVESVFEQDGRFALLSSKIPPGGGTGSPQGLVLLGWLSEAPPDVQVAGRKPAQQTTALLYTPLSYHLSEEGTISLPPGLIPGTLIEMPISGGPCGSQGQSVWIERGQAIFEFQLPEGVRDVRLDALKLVIGAEGGSWQPPDTAVYDWASGAWAALDDPVMGVNIISNAAGLLSDDNLVRVRLASESNQGGCLSLELGLEGKR